MAKRDTKIIYKTRPRVLVSLGRGRALKAILKSARDWEWDLLDLNLTRGTIPPEAKPAGAFVESLPDDPLVTRLREMGCPVVRIGQRPHPQDALCPAVLPDLAAMGRLAAEHFADRGFKDVAFVGYDPLNPNANFREGFVAFEERLAALGVSSHLIRLVETDIDNETDRYQRRSREVGNWLAGLPKPVGVLTHGDFMSARICTMCQTAGLAVPEEVALLGAGNEELTCELSPVALSSVDPNATEQGRQGALLLRRLMDGEAAPREPIMLPPAGIVVRRSTETLAVKDPMVARAIRFMWDHLDQNLSVQDVASEFGLSRRSLERAFQEHLGRGINAELRRRRLERCCELLLTTDLSIVELVPIVGFRSSDYLHTSFKREFGITPRKWQQRERSKS